MGGDVEYQTKSHVSAIGEVDPIDVKEAKTKLNLEDQIHKLTGIVFHLWKFWCNWKLSLISWGLVIAGLKIVIILQVVLIGCVLGFCLFRRRARSRRRYRWENPPWAMRLQVLHADQLIFQATAFLSATILISCGMIQSGIDLEADYIGF